MKRDNEIPITITNIIKFCERYKHEHIAMNMDFTIFSQYIKFKQITQYLMENTHIKLTFFLNEIIEVNSTQQIDIILETYHKTLLGGHVGFERMKNNICKFYTWKDMTQDIKRY